MYAPSLYILAGSSAAIELAEGLAARGDLRTTDRLPPDLQLDYTITASLLSFVPARLHQLSRTITQQTIADERLKRSTPLSRASRPLLLPHHAPRVSLGTLPAAVLASVFSTLVLVASNSMQNSNSQWAAAHGGGENWQWGDLVTPAGGKTPVDAGLAAAAAFDAQYSAAPPSLGGQPSTQAIPTISAFGAQQPGPQATSGDMNVMYDLLGQGALPQSQFDILMGGGMGQDGLAVVAGAMGGGYPPGATAGGVNMRNSTLSYSTASPPTADYLRSNNAASSSAPTPFSYGTPSFSQPPMHHQQMLNNVHSQSSWSSHTPPYQQHPPHQPAPPKPLPPHPAFQAYPSPPISAQMPLPGRPLIPPHILAPHVDSLDRMYLLQNQISEREAILGAGARGRDPAIMSQLKSQLHLLK